MNFHRKLSKTMFKDESFEKLIHLRTNRFNGNNENGVSFEYGFIHSQFQNESEKGI